MTTRSRTPPIFTWPDGYRAAASFTFDVDAESCVLAHDPSRGQPDVADVAPVVRAASGACPQLLQILDAPGRPGDVLRPGFTAECYPEVVRAIADGGHEIGHHGYLHEQMQGIDAATEAGYLDRGLEALQQRRRRRARRATGHRGGS